MYTVITFTTTARDRTDLMGLSSLIIISLVIKSKRQLKHMSLVSDTPGS